MTKLQMVFLVITLAYLMVKMVLFYIIYLVTLQIEAAALERQRHRRQYLARVRARDKERFKEAYQWYEKRKPREESYVTKPAGEDSPVPAETPTTSGNDLCLAPAYQAFR